LVLTKLLRVLVEAVAVVVDRRVFALCIVVRKDRLHRGELVAADASRAHLVGPAAGSNCQPALCLTIGIGNVHPPSPTATTALSPSVMTLCCLSQAMR
jgi:hypothetical protein